MNDQKDLQHRNFSPEILVPFSESSAEHDELEDLLRGMDELSLASGCYSGTQYAIEVLEHMRRQQIEVNPFTMSVVLRHSFGDPEELLSRMKNCSSREELEEMFPGEIGEAAIDYVKPLLGNE